MPVPTPSPALPGTGLGRAVEPYDFRRPAALARDHARRLELVFETFARQWATRLATKVQAPVTATFDHLRLSPYDDYAAALPEATAMVIVALEGREERAVVQFPAEAALSWVGRMLGGPAGPAPAFRELTEVEQTLVRRLTEDALAELHYSFGPLLPAGLNVEGMHFNARTARAAATDALMLVAAFTLHSDGHAFSASVALPAAAVVGQLEDDGGTPDTPAAQLLRGQLVQAPVEVCLELASVPVKAHQVLDLAVGELLTLPHPVGAPFALTLGGKTVALAVGVTHGPRQGGQIVKIEEDAP